MQVDEDPWRPPFFFAYRCIFVLFGSFLPSWSSKRISNGLTAHDLSLSGFGDRNSCRRASGAIILIGAIDDLDFFLHQNKIPAVTDSHTFNKWRRGVEVTSNVTEVVVQNNPGKSISQLSLSHYQMGASQRRTRYARKLEGINPVLHTTVAYPVAPLELTASSKTYPRPLPQELRYSRALHRALSGYHKIVYPWYCFVETTLYFKKTQPVLHIYHWSGRGGGGDMWHTMNNKKRRVHSIYSKNLTSVLYSIFDSPKKMHSANIVRSSSVLSWAHELVTLQLHVLHRRRWLYPQHFAYCRALQFSHGRYCYFACFVKITVTACTWLQYAT